ncbi:hypothetical protein OG216_11095 [Streptomycetaceae bacterium NBC_01309]
MVHFSGELPEDRWRAAWRRNLLLGLVQAFVIPLLAIGVVVAVALFAANGGVKFLVAFAGLAAVVIAMRRRDNFFHLAALSVAPIIAAAFFFVADAVDEYTLEQRGKEANCVVRDIDTRVETSTTTDASGYTSTTSTTYYDHRLDCPGGGPGEMTLRSRAADVGASVLVAYDPAKNVAPRPVSGVDSSPDIVWTCVLVGGAIALRVASTTGHAITTRRRHRRISARG